MTPAHPSSFRARFVCVVLISVLPALLLILYSIGDQRVKDRQIAERKVLRIVRVVAASQQSVLDGARQLLAALSLLPEIHARNSKACSVLFARLLKQNTLYTDFGAADAQGGQYCWTQPLIRQVNVGDRGYFQLAVQRRNFAIGDHQTDRITDKATLNLGYPILAKNGSVTGVVFATVDLTPLREIARVANLPEQGSLAVYDHHGTQLAGFPDVGRSLAASFRDSDIVKNYWRKKRESQR